MGNSYSIPNTPHQGKQPRKVSIQTFLRKYREGGPGVKYEYNQGIVEKTEAMKISERYIVENLREKFQLTQAAKKGGTLECETEVWTSLDQWRKPDVSYLNLEQIKAGANGKEPMPEFIIEIISPNDRIDIIKSKVSEYFAAGLKILWQVYPNHNLVEVYHSPSDIEGCTGTDVCSAEPVVEGFKMKAEDILKKP